MRSKKFKVCNKFLDIRPRIKSLGQIKFGFFPENLLGNFLYEFFLLIFCKKQQKVLPDFGTNMASENSKKGKFELSKV